MKLQCIYNITDTPLLLNIKYLLIKTSTEYAIFSFQFIFYLFFSLFFFLPRCICRCGLAMRILSVCLLSNACIVTKRKKDLFRFLHHTKEHLS